METSPPSTTGVIYLFFSLTRKIKIIYTIIVIIQISKYDVILDVRNEFLERINNDMSIPEISAIIPETINIVIRLTKSEYRIFLYIPPKSG